MSLHNGINPNQGFPHSSVGKESACNAGDLGSIPGLGRSTEEGIGSPLQNSWASLVAQLVKNPPAMQETWVRSLSWEDSLEKGKATHSSVRVWSIPWTIQSTGLQSQTQQLSHTHTITPVIRRHLHDLVTSQKAPSKCHNIRKELSYDSGEGHKMLLL